MDTLSNENQLQSLVRMPAEKVTQVTFCSYQRPSLPMCSLKVYSDLRTIQMRSTECTEHQTFSALHSDKLVSLKTDIPETKQSNLETPAVQLLRRPLSLIINMLALKNISETRVYSSLTYKYFL